MNAKLSPQQIAIQAARQVARESNEILKQAREQIAPTPEIPKQEQKQPEPSNPSKSPQKNLSFLNEYKGELNEIRRENLFKELQRKIAEGIEVPLEDYVTQLSFEQREVLKAQMEAVKMQKQVLIKRKPDTLPQIVGKKARGMITGMIKKRNQQPVETRQPPSS